MLTLRKYDPANPQKWRSIITGRVYTQTALTEIRDHGYVVNLINPEGVATEVLCASLAEIPTQPLQPQPQPESGPMPWELQIAVALVTAPPPVGMQGPTFEDAFKAAAQLIELYKQKHQQ